jgi:hypothetical protein
MRAVQQDGVAPMTERLPDADDIKAQFRLEQVVPNSSDEYQLVGKGRWLRGKQHSSLVVDTKRQLYRWNVTGESGDVLTWMMKRHGVDLPGAIRMLMDGHLPLPTAIGSVQRAAKPSPERTQAPLSASLHLAYHSNLTATARAYWHAQGITDDSIDRYLLGYCEHPVWHETYTIPILDTDGACLFIKHRLVDDRQGKYRNEPSGVRPYLYRNHITPTKSIVLFAGEKKVIVASQCNIPAATSTSGCGHWDDAWTATLPGAVYVAFDEQETENANRVGKRIAGGGKRVRVAQVDGQADEFLLTRGLSEFKTRLRAAKTAR